MSDFRYSNKFVVADTKQVSSECRSTTDDNILFSNMSLSEQIDFELNDQIEKDEIYQLLKDLNESCRGVLNQDEIIRLKDLYEDDEFLDQFSTESWKVTETIKKMLIRFKMFFKKIFGYINNFTILRVKLCIKTAEKWKETLETENITFKGCDLS